MEALRDVHFIDFLFVFDSFIETLHIHTLFFSFFVIFFFFFFLSVCLSLSLASSQNEPYVIVWWKMGASIEKGVIFSWIFIFDFQ